MPCHPSRIRLNSLESIWYCNLAVVITFFLIVDGNRRYHHYSALPWPEGERPTAELRLYLCLIVWATLLIIAFIPTQYLKVGNHANDQSKLGAKGKKRKERETKMESSTEHLDGLQSLSRTMKLAVHNLQTSRRHLGPIGATIHITSAFCLLLPVLFLQARAIQYGLLPPAMIWRTEVGEIYLDQVVGNWSSLQLPEVQSQATVPTGTYSTVYPIPIPEDAFSAVVITINYLNYVVPLFLYAIRYADVFWVCHKGFALLVSFQLMMNAVQYALGFIGMSLLYKLHWYGYEKYDIRRAPVFSSGPSLIAAFLLNNITVFVAAAILYLYGYGKLKRSQRKSIMGDATDLESMFAFKCNGFLPHIGAMCALVVFICCKTPFMIEYVAIYQFSGDQRMLCCVVFDSLFIIFWFVLWIFLTVKRHWNFSHVQLGSIEEGHDTSASERYIANHVNDDGSVANMALEEDPHMSTYLPYESLADDQSDGKVRKLSNGARSGEDIEKVAECATDDVDEGIHQSCSVELSESFVNGTSDADVNIVSNPIPSPSR